VKLCASDVVDRVSASHRQQEPGDQHDNPEAEEEQRVGDQTLDLVEESFGDRGGLRSWSFIVVVRVVIVIGDIPGRDATNSLGV
jgi:hypothetical protein